MSEAPTGTAFVQAEGGLRFTFPGAARSEIEM